MLVATATPICHLSVWLPSALSLTRKVSFGRQVLAHPFSGPRFFVFRQLSFWPPSELSLAVKASFGRPV
jgi:hypothetical protein